MMARMNSTSPQFKENARKAMADAGLQKALGTAKGAFLQRRAAAVAGLPEFERLRDVARDIKNHTLANLDFYLESFAGNVERAGGKVAITPGDPRLMKLTYPEDFAMAEQLAGGARVTRIGQGVDAHRWGPGEAVWLCGVKIEHDQTLIGHSDADAGLHALTDAILGAIGEGDIGEHFPPSDPQWKGAASDRFLLHAVEILTNKGGRIVNADVTLVCERPKIRPHRDAMRQRLAVLLGVPLDRVSVKATTTEGMGFTGRQEGLLAQAIVAVETPS